MKRIWWCVPIVAVLAAPAALADARDDYNRRVAERYTAMFRMADRNGDNVVTRAEATGIVELEAAFDDIDVDRDGSLGIGELKRYVETALG